MDAGESISVAMDEFWTPDSIQTSASKSLGSWSGCGGGLACFWYLLGMCLLGETETRTVRAVRLQDGGWW